VHVKTLRSQKLRMLLTHRQLLQSKAIAIEKDLRSTLRNFGLKVGMVGKVKFEARIRELVEQAVCSSRIAQCGVLRVQGGVRSTADALLRP
jgi:transposase